MMIIKILLCAFFPIGATSVIVSRLNLALSDSNFTMNIPNFKESASSLPTAVRVINSAVAYWPGWIVSIKGGAGKFKMYFPAFEIIYPNGENILVDAGVTEDFVQKMLSNSDGRLVKDGQNEIIKAASRIKSMVFTHEHNDHLAGLKLLTESLVCEKSLLSKEQLESPEYPLRWVPDQWKGQLKQFSFDENGNYHLSPGVTLIKTPGHTKGSLSVYHRCSVKTYKSHEYPIITH